MATANAVPVFTNGRTGHFDTSNSEIGRGINQISYLPDGKIIAVGNARLLRFNADGSPDETFDDDGSLTMWLGPNGGMGWTDLDQITALPNGKILITGAVSQDTTRGLDTSLLVVRLNADGSPDPTFNNGAGKVVNNPNEKTYDLVVGTEILSDGRILLAASSSHVENDKNTGISSPQDIVLARYLANGQPDPSFGTNGIRIVGDSQTQPSEMVVQADGKILVVGSKMTSPAYYKMTLLRYNSDGTPDLTFGNGGSVVTEFDSSTYNKTSRGMEIAVQADGKIVAVGSAPPPTSDQRLQSGFAVVRYNQDGTLDQTFSGDGKFAGFIWADDGTWRPHGDRAWGDNFARDLHLNDDGSMIIAGTTFRGTTTAGQDDMQLSLIRLDADGTFDTSFGANGYVTTGPVPGVMYPYITFGNLIVGPDGKMIIGGATSVQGIGYRPFMTGYNADGTLDATFGAGASGAQNSTVYLAGHPDQFLNRAILIKDADVANGGNYAGSHVILTRAGGAHPDDHFTAGGELRFKNGKAMLDGVEIGSVVSGNGTLRIDFNKAATQARVNEVLQSISYENAHPAAAPRMLTVNWTFGDANASANFATVVSMQSIDVPYWIDALLDRRAAGQTADQLRLQLESFAGAGKNFGVQFDSSGPGSFSVPQRQLIDSLLAEMDGILGLNFGGTGTPLRIKNSVELSAGESAATPLTSSGAAAFVAMPPDNANKAALLHALGHALGLKDGDRPSLNGSMIPVEEYPLSVMNNASAGVHQHLGELDIAALQFLYGPNTSARPGNDVYQLSETTSNFIWDGAGIDTVSAAGLSADITLHLAPGFWDHIGNKGRAITAGGQITVNYGSVIENAIGGLGNDSISGTATANALHGGAGNDRLEGLGGDDQLDGGAGIDTALFSGLRSAYTVKREGAGFTVRDQFGSGGLDTLVNVERIAFSNGMLALDIDGHAGQAYRMYKAVFGRDPDAAGLGYWIAAMDKGMSADDVAKLFMASPEFAVQYGANPDSTRLITTLYKNVLHREPDAGGFSWWQGMLDKRAISASDALTGFSDSAENRAQVIGEIGNGIAFTPFYG